MTGPISYQGTDRRVANRRAGKLGGRRRQDRKLPWWRGGLSVAAIGVLLRYWRLISRTPSRLTSRAQ
jgi:hypothetical protein